MKYLLALSLVFLELARAEGPVFEKTDMKIGSATVHVGIADTDEKRAHGLMFVKSLGADEGMIFVFEREEPLSFWMKNTVIPLSIGFFDHRGILVDVQEMTPPASVMVTNPPIYPSAAPATFALEMNAGWFTKKGLKKGARLQLAGATKSALLKRQLSSGPSSSK